MSLKTQFREYINTLYKDTYSTRELNGRADDIMEEPIIAFILDKLEELGA